MRINPLFVKDISIPPQFDTARISPSFIWASIGQLLSVRRAQINLAVCDVRRDSLTSLTSLSVVLFWQNHRYLHSGCWIPCCDWADRWWTGFSQLGPRWSPLRTVSDHRDPSQRAQQNQHPVHSTTPACKARINGSWEDVKWKTLEGGWLKSSSPRGAFSS